MVADSVCCSAIYQGTDQGGVWMKWHEVKQTRIGQIGNLKSVKETNLPGDDVVN